MEKTPAPSGMPTGKSTVSKTPSWHGLGSPKPAGKLKVTAALVFNGRLQSFSVCCCAVLRSQIGVAKHQSDHLLSRAPPCHTCMCKLGRILTDHRTQGREQTALELPQIKRRGFHRSTFMIAVASWPFTDSLASRTRDLLRLFLVLLVK